MPRSAALPLVSWCGWLHPGGASLIPAEHPSSRRTGTELTPQQTLKHPQIWGLLPKKPSVDSMWRRSLGRERPTGVGVGRRFGATPEEYPYKPALTEERRRRAEPTYFQFV